jgi:hypothetical protein
MQNLIMWHHILFKSSIVSLASLAVLCSLFLPRTRRDIDINMYRYLAKCLLFFSDFNQILFRSTNFIKSPPPYKKIMNFFSRSRVVSCGYTGMTKLSVFVIVLRTSLKMAVSQGQIPFPVKTRSFKNPLQNSATNLGINFFF